MAVDQMIQKVQAALKLSKMRSKLPRNPKLVDIRVEDYVDTDGEDALRMTVILDESVDVEELTGDEISDLKMTDSPPDPRTGRRTLALFHPGPNQSELDEVDDESEE